MRRSLYVIYTIARTEARLALRSHVWRIALILNCALLVTVRFIDRAFELLFSPGGGPRWVLGAARINRFIAVGLPSLPSTYPLISLMYANVFLAVSMGILASQSIARDRGQDTSEPVMAKDFSLLVWAAGKTGGLLAAFAIHIAAVLLITFAHAIVFKGTAPTAAGYLAYPILVSLPVFALFTGFPMLLRSLTGSRALTVTAIVAAAGLLLFYGAEHLLYIFDAFAWGMPVLVSQMIGFEDLPALLVQRGAFLFAGAAMAAGAYLLLPRPRQSRAAVLSMRTAVAVSLVLAVGLPTARITDIYGGRELRSRMISLSRELAAEPAPTPESFNLAIEHHGGRIAGTATIALRNGNQEPLGEYILNLNPGLRVEHVERAAGTGDTDNTADSALGFERRLHLLLVTPATPLRPGDRDTIIVSYGGCINDDACFPGCDESSRWRAGYYLQDLHESAFDRMIHFVRYSNQRVRFGRRFSFAGGRFVLLPPWSMWYPAPGVVRGSGDPLLERPSFATYRLAFYSGEGNGDARHPPLRDPRRNRGSRQGDAGRLAVVFQGRKTGEQEGWTFWETEHPSRDITLLAGEYRVKEIEVDSIRCSLAMVTPDEKLIRTFAALGDTLPAIIREVRGEFERKIGLEYPLPYFTFAEVPVQFHAPGRPLVSNARGYSQPGLILLHEKGSMAGIGHFYVTDESGYSHPVRLGDPLPRRDAARQLKMIFAVDDPAFSLIPSFYGGAFHLASPCCPVLDNALESFFAEGVLWTIDIDRYAQSWLVELDEACVALEGRSLAGLLADPAARDEAVRVLPYKGKELFLRLGVEGGSGRIGEFLRPFIEAHRFETVPDSVFFGAFHARTGVDAAPVVEQWYRSTELPAFVRGEPEIFRVVDGERERWQLLLRARNEGKVSGLLRIVVITGRTPVGETRSRKKEQAYQYLFDPGEGKEIGILLDGAPRAFTVNTLISRDIPAVVNTFVKDIESRPRSVPLDGERPLPPDVFAPPPGEVVVDDLDEGFEVIRDPRRSLMARLSTGRTQPKYANFNWREPPGVWTRVVQIDCFGRYVRSAMMIAAGHGHGVVRWTARLPEGGTYEVWHHMVDPWGNLKSNFRRKTCTQEYHFTVRHEDGVDRPVVRIWEHEPGWVLLGTYRVGAGEAVVELSDESPEKFILADAVKFIRVR